MRRTIEALIITSLLCVTTARVAQADSATDRVFAAAQKLSTDTTRNQAYKIDILVHLMERVDQSQLELLHRQTSGAIQTSKEPAAMPDSAIQKSQRRRFDRKAISRSIAKRLLM